MLKTVFIFEWKKATATTSFYITLVALLLISLYALFNGKNLISTQQKNIRLAVAREDAVFDRIIDQIQHPDTVTDGAKWAYGHLTDAGWTITSPNKRWTSYWKPTPLSFLSVGNRDVYPYYHELEPYSFYMRFFKNEISSPFKLLYGNFDLAFVIVLLFPLFVIAFTFDAYSSEVENGTYPILNSVTLPRQIINNKLLFYLSLTLVLLNLVLLISLFFADQLNFVQWLIFVLIANVYVLIWFLLIYAISLLKRSSVVNAILLITCWIFLTIGLPAISNAVANAKYPVNASVFSKYIRRVQMTDNSNEKKARLHEFYRYYPQYARTDTIGPAYFNKIYIAFGNLNDRQADPLLEKYFSQMKQRESFLTNCNFFNPVTRCQQAFNTLAGTDLTSYIDYVKNARQYVQVLKEDLTEKCFDQVPLTVGELRHRLSFDQFLQNQKK